MLKMIERVMDAYVENYSDEQVLCLLKTISHTSQGGLGYRITTHNPVVEFDGWEVDHVTKSIKLDTSSVVSKYSIKEIAENLNDAIEVEVTKQRQSMLSRVSWGSGMIVIGVVETVIGAVGVIIPEPGTTVAGVGMVILGSNSFVDGVSRLSGANQGNGYNLLSMGFGKIGALSADAAGFDPVIGKQVGKGVFAVSSIMLGSYGSIKILNVKSLSAIRFGVGGQPGGVEVGRVAMGYASSRAKDGMTIINISNNSGQYILRFVTHSGKLVVNGRIVGVSRVLNHEGNWRLIMKGLLKLLVHGAKVGM
jgi:hypothetical protein